MRLIYLKLLFCVIVINIIVVSPSLGGPWIPSKPKFYTTTFYKDVHLAFEENIEDQLKLLDAKSKFNKSIPSPSKKFNQNAKIIKEVMLAKHILDGAGFSSFIQIPINSNFSTEIDFYLGEGAKIFKFKNKFLLLNKRNLIVSLIMPAVEVIHKSKLDTGGKIDIELKQESEMMIDLQPKEIFYGCGISIGGSFIKRFLYVDATIFKSKTHIKLNTELAYSSYIFNSEILTFLSITKIEYSKKIKSTNLIDLFKSIAIKGLNSISMLNDDGIEHRKFTQEIMLKIHPINMSISFGVGIEKINGIDATRTYSLGFEVCL